MGGRTTKNKSPNAGVVVCSLMMQTAAFLDNCSFSKRQLESAKKKKGITMVKGNSYKCRHKTSQKMVSSSSRSCELSASPSVDLIVKYCLIHCPRQRSRKMDLQSALMWRSEESKVSMQTPKFLFSCKSFSHEGLFSGFLHYWMQVY